MVFRVLRWYFRVFRYGGIQTRAMEIWKVKYERWKWMERRARRGQVVDGSGYDRSSMMLRQVAVFWVLRAGIGQSGKVVEILKACRPIICHVSFLCDELR